MFDVSLPRLKPESKENDYLKDNLEISRITVIKAKLHRAFVGSNKIDDYIIANGRGGILESPLALISIFISLILLFLIFKRLFNFNKCKGIFNKSKLWIGSVIRSLINQINFSILITLILAFLIIEVLIWIGKVFYKF